MYCTCMYMFRKSASEDVNSVAFFAQMDALIDIEVALISSARFLAMRVFFRPQPYVLSSRLQ